MIGAFGLDQLQTALEVAGLDRPAAIVAASAGVITPPAAIVVLLRQPTRRPGLPDWPFSNGRPRTRPGPLGVNPSVIVISLVERAGHSRSRSRPGVCDAN
jgi:hypothetical protein